MTGRTSDTVLTALGFSRDVDDLYRRLRPQSGRDLVRVAASLLRTTTELREDLGPLVDAGLVRVVDDTLEVVSPIELLRSVVDGHLADATRVRDRLDGIAQAASLLAAEGARGEPSATQPLDGEVMVVGGGDVLELIETLVRRGSGDLWWLRPDQWRGRREDRMADLVAEAVAQGRRSLAIYPVRVVQDAPQVLRTRVEAGEEVRVLPELPTRMLVMGDSHVVLPEPLGLSDLPLVVVRQHSVVGAMRLWFRSMWQQAEIPPLAAVEPPVDVRRFLLSELAAGARDEQMARKLGLSLRTVRRRVAALMAELGVDTRFQAGVEATRRGWV